MALNHNHDISKSVVLEFPEPGTRFVPYAPPHVVSGLPQESIRAAYFQTPCVKCRGAGSFALPEPPKSLLHNDGTPGSQDFLKENLALLKSQQQKMKAERNVTEDSFKRELRRLRKKQQRQLYLDSLLPEAREAELKREQTARAKKKADRKLAKAKKKHYVEKQRLRQRGARNANAEGTQQHTLGPNPFNAVQFSRCDVCGGSGKQPRPVSAADCFRHGGLLWWLGTHGGFLRIFTNPTKDNRVHVSSHPGWLVPGTHAESNLRVDTIAKHRSTAKHSSRDGLCAAAAAVESQEALNSLCGHGVPTGEICCSLQAEQASFTVSLHKDMSLLAPSHYRLRHGNPNVFYALSDWELQGSLDGVRWVLLKKHKADTSLAEIHGRSGPVRVDQRDDNSSRQVEAVNNTHNNGKSTENRNSSEARGGMHAQKAPVAGVLGAYSWAQWKLDPATFSHLRCANASEETEAQFKRRSRQAVPTAFRHYRVEQQDYNAGGTKHLFCSGIELFGVIVGEGDAYAQHPDDGVGVGDPASGPDPGPGPGPVARRKAREAQEAQYSEERLHEVFEAFVAEKATEAAKQREAWKDRTDFSMSEVTLVTTTSGFDRHTRARTHTPTRAQPGMFKAKLDKLHSDQVAEDVEKELQAQIDAEDRKAAAAKAEAARRLQATEEQCRRVPTLQRPKFPRPLLRCPLGGQPRTFVQIRSDPIRSDPI